jgi:hypothetical protein
LCGIKAGVESHFFARKIAKKKDGFQPFPKIMVSERTM